LDLDADFSYGRWLSWVGVNGAGTILTSLMINVQILSSDFWIMLVPGARIELARYFVPRDFKTKIGKIQKENKYKNLIIFHFFN
jgi:hypothetical protein